MKNEARLFDIKNKVKAEKPYVIFGGAGFIGTNTATRLLEKGKSVVIFDNVSRQGVGQNLEWLKTTYPDRLGVEKGDVRDRCQVKKVIEEAGCIFNFAAQVAVTTSLTDPMTDFEINAGGTINILEAVRATGRKIPVIFTSTNKVYGGLNDVKLYENDSRYIPIDKRIRAFGVDETRPLDFHSPYGCSKGSADQYILDYSRCYDIPTVVFRMSCIYGTHQFGNEDQGWVAHFFIQALRDKKLKIFGDGKQVRDILFVEDLVDAFEAALENIDDVKGKAFNMGGGASNSISLLELLDQIMIKTGKSPEVDFFNWREGDQKYYVSDTTKFHTATGWCPRNSINDGLEKLTQWITENILTQKINQRSETVNKKRKLVY